ncbi:SURF1 family protein [Lysobacter capsici]|uniref:SURF1 family protein n=1 Tax=Lysobacter capsici TaxID=435897 RepID=UPI001C003945|nr:SURF1 family protein [Lysobacter capsici]QWF19512.1 SURF1 family protein [Lysobacter capsici]
MTATTKPPRSPFALAALLLLFLAAFLGLIALGVWQIQRRAWKLDLIQRVDARVHAPPGAAPAPSDWPTVSADRDEYKHVQLEGQYLPVAATRVQAVTELGPGFWLLQPFQTAGGEIVLINRGFAPNERKAAEADEAPADTRVTGLLRLSEPGGGFLRKNAPEQNRWYSRDVQAIAARLGLKQVAPYFIDADRSAPLPSDPTAEPTWPVGGLTVIKFPNSHLSYALTWFALALMVVFAAWRVYLEERRRRRSHGA